MPAAPKIALAVLLAASIVRAFFGPPPPRPHGTLAPAAAAAGFMAYGVALALALLDRATEGALLIVTGVEALCLAVWLARGRDDRGYDDGGEAEPDPPFDWTEFDRERARWSPQRPHDHTPTAA